uniref:G_PROTEIN_RECEP_F2_4 domain-containing protein n=1 Tax=Heterorhabditis bacteriophora TaxID=37862 RepID=A0A1I7XCB0_HETBA
MVDWQQRECRVDLSPSASRQRPITVCRLTVCSYYKYDYIYIYIFELYNVQIHMCSNTRIDKLGLDTYAYACAWAMCTVLVVIPFGSAYPGRRDGSSEARSA